VTATCFYEGVVEHRRRLPVEHHFRQRVFMLYLDLAEVDDIFSGSLLWSATRPAWAWFRRKDYLGDPAQPLDVAVRQHIADAGVAAPEGPIRLLTHLRFAGVWFNPISLYYCFDVDEELAVVVAEVTNTPWGERRAYVLDARGDGSRQSRRGAFGKEMHVSPFLPMDIEYRWALTVPSETLGVAIACWRGDDLLLDTGLSLRRRPFDAASRRRLLLRHPAMSVAVLRGIYWQALRLWAKGARYHPHPRHHAGAGSAPCPGRPVGALTPAPEEESPSPLRR
jgi:DUF1365 family protein